MLLVDSSVWIDYLASASTDAVALLDRQLAERFPIGTTGIIIQEVLQGIRSDRDANIVRARLSALPYLPATKTTHARAASLYRRLKARGVTVPAVDALIAAVAVEGRAELLTEDVDHFEALAKVSKLRLQR